jgi:hypothetical protein
MRNLFVVPFVRGVAASLRPVGPCTGSLAGCAALALALAGALSAQTVAFPGVPLASPPSIAFPFYTPGGGSTGDTVRAQFLCPDSFLSTQGLQPGLVTHVSFSLAGAAVYDVFELRVGATSVPTLGPDWSVNLPDQRLQRDLGGVSLVGGGSAGAPANQWVEFELDRPIAWQPGEGLVVDLTTHILVTDTYLGTTSVSGGLGGMQRAVNFAYVPGAPATAFSGSGIALQFRFAPFGMVSFGAGCAGSTGVAPHLEQHGSTAIGDTVVLVAHDTVPDGLGAFVFGHSRRASPGGVLPLSLGGGCMQLVADDVMVLLVATGTVAAVGFAVPPDPLLRGAVLYVQWGQLDPGSPATLMPITVSEGGVLTVF